MKVVVYFKDGYKLEFDKVSLLKEGKFFVILQCNNKTELISKSEIIRISVCSDDIDGKIEYIIS